MGSLHPETVPADGTTARPLRTDGETRSAGSLQPWPKNLLFVCLSAWKLDLSDCGWHWAKGGDLLWQLLPSRWKRVFSQREELGVCPRSIARENCWGRSVRDGRRSDRHGNRGSAKQPQPLVPLRQDRLALQGQTVRNQSPSCFTNAAQGEGTATLRSWPEAGRRFRQRTGTRSRCAGRCARDAGEIRVRSLAGLC